MTWRALALLALLSAVGPRAQAATLRVSPSGPGDYRDIQSALSAASNGDTVLVAPDVYAGPANRNLDFSGKGMVLVSEAGPAATVIDCEHLGRGFYLHSSETSATVIAGFTIINGETTDRGGGIFCEGASPRIVGCVISGCRANEGAAVYAMDSALTLTNCALVGNQAVRGGGGIRILRGGAGAHLTDCTLAGNTATTYGGGVYCCYSAPVVTDCTITGNAASNGGAVYGYDASPVITNTILAFSPTGAAVFCPGASSFTITHCCAFGNAGGDSLCGEHHDNTFADPAFCDTTAGSFDLQECSPCLGAGAGGTDIGAWGAGCPCGTSGVPETTPPSQRPVLRAYPNPARGGTALVLDLPPGASPPATVTIHDLRGRLVRRLEVERMQDGSLRALWDGEDSDGRSVPCGVYFASAGTTAGTVRKLVVLE
jgi:hypothetical protein